MTREEEIRARLVRMEAEPTFQLFAGHVAGDIRYLLEKVERLEKPTVESVSAAFAKLTDDDRSDVVADYCTSCWRKDPRCQCWNDE